MTPAMPEAELAAIEARLRWALDGLPNWDCYRQGNYLEGWGAEELLDLVAEVRRLRAEVARMYLNTTTETRAEWADPT